MRIKSVSIQYFQNAHIYQLTLQQYHKVVILFFSVLIFFTPMVLNFKMKT